LVNDDQLASYICGESGFLLSFELLTNTVQQRIKV